MDISSQKSFNHLCGFQQSEIKALAEQAIEQEWLPGYSIEALLQLLRTFYNGYCFSTKTTETVYNPTMSLFFFNTIQKGDGLPDNMLDNNLAMDRGKIAYIAQLPGGQSIIEAAVQHQPLSIVHLMQSFGIEDVLYTQKDDTFILCLLYFFGVLTLEGKDPFGELKLAIPNLVINKLYIQQFRESYLKGLDWNRDVSPAIEHFYNKGDLQPLCDLVQKRGFSALDNRDYRQLNELTIKTAFLLFLFDDKWYQVDSERRVGRGYADLTLILRPDARQYPIFDFLLEFKYLSLKQLGLTAKTLKAMSEKRCRNLKLVKKAFNEAKEQLTQYSQELQAKYANDLKLHNYAIVAIGLERLLWLEV